MMAVQRVQIPVSFQYVPATGPSTGDLVPVVGASLTILDRVTTNPATLYQAFTGGATIGGTPTTDTGGNVPGYVVEGSYSITAAPTGSFTGATINWEAVRGDGVENLYPGAVNNAAIAAGAITLDKLATALQQLLVPTGTILDYAGSAAPAGFHLCDGTVQSQTGTYAALYAIVGSTYNTGGEGAGNFRLPNLQGRFKLGKGANGYNTLGGTGGSLGHIHPLGTPTVNINLGTPAVTVSVPGLPVPGHTHPLSRNGGAQLRAHAGTIAFGTTPAIYIISGDAGPTFSSSGFAMLNVGNAPSGSSLDSGTSFWGDQSSYALIGNTDQSGSVTTSGSAAGGTVNNGQTASGNVNGGQNTQGSDPAYVTLNQIIKL